MSHEHAAAEPLSLPMRQSEMEVESSLAHMAALQDVSRILLLPEHLRKVPNFIAEYRGKKAAVDAQLSTLIQTQVEEAKRGLEKVSLSVEGMEVLNGKFKHIDKLSHECETLIDQYSLVKGVTLARKNISATLRHLDQIYTIPEEVEDIREAMNDPHNLVIIHQRIRALEQRAEFVYGEVEMANEVDQTQLKVLREHFSCVKELSCEMEDMMWRLLRNCLNVARNNPGVLVQVMQIVDAEEQADREAYESRDTSKHDIKLRGYHGECIEQLQRSISERFEGAIEPEDTIDQILTIADTLMEDLTTAMDYVVPCFPESFDVFNIFVKEYNRRLDSLFAMFGKNASELSSADILAIVSWRNRYMNQLTHLGVPPSQQTLGAGIDSLVSRYVNNIAGMMNTWCNNMLKAELENPPEQDNEGLYYTLSPIDLFKMLNQQVSLLEKVDHGKMLMDVARTCLLVINNFQQMLTERLTEHWKDLYFEYLCAIVNNNEKSVEYASQLTDHITGVLEEEMTGKLDFESMTIGFDNLIKLARSTIVTLIFQDLQVPLGQLFAKEWLEGNVMGSVLDTMRDYFTDIKACIQAVHFRKLVQECIDRTVYNYIRALLKGHRSFQQDAVARIEEDIGMATGFFGEYIREKLVTKGMRPLELLRGVVSSTNPEMIAFDFDELCCAYPDMPLRVAELIIQQRSDWTKDQRVCALDGCRTVFASKPASTVPIIKSVFAMVLEEVDTGVTSKIKKLYS